MFFNLSRLNNQEGAFVMYNFDYNYTLQNI